MFGLTGVLIALVVLTIALAGVFLMRPSITAGVTGKILAFIGLCVLPALCISTGMSSTCGVPNKRHTAFRATAWKATDKVCMC